MIALELKEAQLIAAPSGGKAYSSATLCALGREQGKFPGPVLAQGRLEYYILATLMKAKPILTQKSPRITLRTFEALESLKDRPNLPHFEVNCPSYEKVLKEMHYIGAILQDSEIEYLDDIIFDVYNEAIRFLEADSVFMEFMTKWNDMSYEQLYDQFTVNDEIFMDQPCPYQVFPQLQEKINVFRSFGLVCCIFILNEFYLDRTDHYVFSNSSGLKISFM